VSSLSPLLCECRCCRAGAGRSRHADIGAGIVAVVWKLVLVLGRLFVLSPSPLLCG